MAKNSTTTRDLISITAKECMFSEKVVELIIKKFLKNMMWALLDESHGNKVLLTNAVKLQLAEPKSGSQNIGVIVSPYTKRLKASLADNVKENARMFGLERTIKDLWGV